MIAASSWERKRGEGGGLLGASCNLLRSPSRKLASVFLRVPSYVPVWGGGGGSISEVVLTPLEGARVRARRDRAVSTKRPSLSVLQ